LLPKITPHLEEDFDKTRALAPQQATAMVAEGDPDELRPGTLAGAYVLERSLASGGGGTVYEARHRLLGRIAAVKVLRRELAASPRMVARFLREALAVNLIKHPAIVDIYEFGELPDGRPYYVMELLSGTDLRSLLTERGRFEPREVLKILEPVCSALSAAHAQGIVHRDLKASNIHVETTADGERKVKLLDFGIAKLLRPEDEEAGLTVAGARLGTSYTMAPEQIRCDTIDGRTDVYALGVVLYHLLAGQYPFRGEFMTDIERMHLEAPVPRVSQVVAVSPAIDAVIMKAMEKQRDRRFQDPDAFIAALRAAVAPGSSESEQATGRAMAIYVDVRVPEDADSDAILDDASAVLDAAESALRDDGWQVLLQTGNTLLGAKVLPTGAADATAACGAGQVTAEQLVDVLAYRESATAEVAVNVSIHVDQAILNGAAKDSEIVGGAVTSVSAWAPQGAVDGLYVTPSFFSAARHLS